MAPELMATVLISAMTYSWKVILADVKMIIVNAIELCLTFTQDCHIWMAEYQKVISRFAMLTSTSRIHKT